jgi:hypothetical protein
LIKVKANDSPVWKDLLKIRHRYLKGREYKVNNGMSVSFWMDCWLEKKPLCAIYHIMFDLPSDKNISVHEVWSEGWVIHFEVIPQEIIRNQWYELAAKLNSISLNNNKDLPLWKWNVNKIFSVKSVYDYMTRNDAGVAYKRVWKAKIPKK